MLKHIVFVSFVCELILYKWSGLLFYSNNDPFQGKTCDTNVTIPVLHFILLVITPWFSKVKTGNAQRKKNLVCHLNTESSLDHPHTQTKN